MHAEVLRIHHGLGDVLQHVPLWPLLVGGESADCVDDKLAVYPETPGDLGLAVDHKIPAPRHRRPASYPRAAIPGQQVSA